MRFVCLQNFTTHAIGFKKIRQQSRIVTQLLTSIPKWKAFAMMTYVCVQMLFVKAKNKMKVPQTSSREQPHPTIGCTLFTINNVLLNRMRS